MDAATGHAIVEGAGRAPSFWMDGADGTTTGAGQHDGFAGAFPVRAGLVAGPQWLHCGVFAAADAMPGRTRQAIRALPPQALSRQ
jgi:hypothetical protein